MKKCIFLFVLSLLLSVAYPQYENQFVLPDQGKVAGGLGLNWIDGQLYYNINFRPEVSLGNFGAGLDLKLDFDKNGKLRKENFNEFSDYISVIRYLRYGLKGDPVFVKLGALDYYTLGNGSIMYMYNNSPSYDVRHSGLVVDVDFGLIGLESIYSNFGEAGVVGIRGYTRPFKFTSLGDIPIIGNITVGVTYASDFNKYAGITSGVYSPSKNDFISKNDNGAINILGADLTLPLLNTGIVGVKLYTDFAKIVNFGSGVATGIIVNLNGLGLVNAQAKLERQFNGKKYIPSYFNSLYEVERFRLDTLNSTNLQVNSKIRKLEAMGDGDNGYFGSLGVDVLGLFYVTGSYQRLDKSPNSGILNINAQIAPEQFPVVVRSGYNKINIKDETDLFKLDDRSYLFFELGYKPMSYLLVSMVYNWTFTPVRDNDKNIVNYKPIKRIEPRVTFIYPFNM